MKVRGELCEILKNANNRVENDMSPNGIIETVLLMYIEPYDE